MLDDLFPGLRRPVRPGYWFAQKRYGFGAVPATAAGWITMLVFALLLGLTVTFLPGKAEKGVVAGCLIALFFTLCWLKTDGGWRWRWGDDGKE